MSLSYYENCSRFIPAHWHPGIFIDFVCQQGIHANKLLRGTGLFLEDITEKQTFVSVKQFSQIVTHAQSLTAASDLALSFGSRLFPGNFDQLSAALNYSANLMEAMQILAAYPLVAFPLLKARLVESEMETGIEWQDIFGLGRGRQWSVEMACAAWLSFSKWQSGLDLPWRFEFDFAKPAHMEQYEVHLADAVNLQTGGQNLLFNRAACRMWIHRDYLFSPWRFASSTVCNYSLNALASSRLLHTDNGFCGVVADLLEANICKNMQLQNVAQALLMSSSTLKRKLKGHNSSFQFLSDAVKRKHSVDLMLKHKLGQEEVARSLGIQDSANFRRSFKRWTGCSPAEYLQNC